MAAPSFVDIGTDAVITTTGGSSNVVGSSTSLGADQFYILQIYVDGTGTGPTLAPVVAGENRYKDLAGNNEQVTQIGSGAFQVGSPQSGQMFLYAMRSVSSSQVRIKVTAGGSDDVFIRFYRFSGVNGGSTLGAVMEQNGGTTPATSSGSSTTIADADVITTAADRLACNFVAVDDDNALDAFTGMSGGTWAEAVAELASSSGTDAALGLQTATMASSGTIGGGSDTMAASDGWGVVGFALIGGATTWTSSVTSPYTVTIATAGFKTTTSSLAIPLTVSIATNGVRTRFGTADIPLTVSIATAGIRTRFGTADVPLTVSIATAGIATHLASVTSPFTVSIATAGFKTTASSLAVPLTVSIATNGVRTRFGAVDLPLTASIATNGVRTRFSSVTLPLTVSIATAGTVQGSPFGSVTLPLSVNFGTAGFASKSSSVALPLTAAVATAGFKTTASSVALPLSVLIATAGSKTTSSSLAVPLVLTIFVDGTVQGGAPASAPNRLLLGVGT